MNKQSSFSSAGGAFPTKILRNKRLVQNILDNGSIIPLHIQLNPTNVCNLSCKFCSCRNRQRKEQLDFEQLSNLITKFARLGTKAVTITGGGEPLTAVGALAGFADMCSDLGIEVGLVTNGLLAIPEYDYLWKNCRWVRVSVSDESDIVKLIYTLEPVVQAFPSIDWAFSYVVGPYPDPLKLGAALEFATRHKFTHVRVVSDIMDSNVTLDKIRQGVAQFKEGLFDPNLLIWQDRSNYGPGDKDCWISLLKPVIGADGYIYPCCGAQYAKPGEEGDYPVSMRMGHIDNLGEIWVNQKKFDGRQCVKCYYQHYNRVLSAMLDPVSHERFV